MRFRKPGQSFDLRAKFILIEQLSNIHTLRKADVRLWSVCKLVHIHKISLKTVEGSKLLGNYLSKIETSYQILTLSNVNLLLTPDAQHCNVFPEMCIVGFKRRKSLKDLLVGAKIPVEKETDGKSCGCQGKHCEVCIFLEKKALTHVLVITTVVTEIFVMAILPFKFHFMLILC